MGYRIDEVVGNNIKALRTERRLTQAGLASLAGVTKQTISHIESGLGCNAKTAEKIAQSLDVSPLVLYKFEVDDLTIELKKAPIKPARINTIPYVEKLEKTVDSIFASAKEVIYYSCVAPTVKAVFMENQDVIIANIKGKQGEDLLSALSDNLLTAIRQAIFNDMVDDEEMDDLVEGDDING